MGSNFNQLSILTLRAKYIDPSLTLRRTAFLNRCKNRCDTTLALTWRKTYIPLPQRVTG
jgi:hypothetical protein